MQVEHNKHTVNSNTSRRKVIPPLEFPTGSGSDLWAELYRSKSSQHHLWNPTQLNSRKTQRYRTSLMWFWMSAIYPPPLHLCFLFPFLPTSSGSLAVSGCNLALTCPDQHIKAEKEAQNHGRGVWRTGMMVWMRVEVGWRGIHERRNGLDGCRWEMEYEWEWKRGRDGGQRRLGERKRSRLRGYWFLYKDPWIWCGRPWHVEASHRRLL